MNQRFWNGILVTLLAHGIGITFSNYAEAAPAVNQDSQVKPPSEEQVQKSAASASASTQSKIQPPEVLKEGEYQSTEATEAEQAVIAKIQSHEIQGRQAATLYVRSIPILTFLSNNSGASSDTKMGEVLGNQNGSSGQREGKTAQNHTKASSREDANKHEDDPIMRASAVAAKINQLNRNNLAADKITVSWKPKCKCYAIKANSEELVRIDAKTVLADNNRNRATDALQATNRLRRLMGNAPPLRAIADLPAEKSKRLSLATVVMYQLRGIASWYGEDSSTASGESFRPDGLTAAHRSLPFGTKVRVTNLNNGRSVIVRINDRGPFIRGRIIDLSTGAARVLGMLGTGIAPVRVEVLGTQQQAVFADNY